VAVAGSIEALPEGLGADLVVAAYALAEIPLPRVAAAARKLWAASSAMLVIVEPGTPAGFARIRAAREVLLGQGAVPVAPCTHALACPIQGDDWCHFSVRLARSRAHMHAKGASVPFEDERFAYLVLARDGEPSGLGRIVAPPLHAKPGSSFRVCAQGRIETRHIARRQKASYKQARKLDWGGIMGEDAT
jgi:ribosomal protein RSM22 (predicted rRNA methylase)